MSGIQIDPTSQDFDDETGELDPEWYEIPAAFAEAWEEVNRESNEAPAEKLGMDFTGLVGAEVDVCEPGS